MRYLYLIYQWCVAVPILLVLTALTAIVTIVMSGICGNHFWGYYPAHIWSRCVCILLMVKVKVKGRENIDPGTSYVFVANHQGAFDIWAIYGYLNHDFKWLMKKELEKIFLVGKACRRAGHIMVDDSSVAGIRSTIEESEKRLKGGMSLVIFVVPTTIDGAFRRMPRTTYNATPGVITLTIHKPIYPGERGFNTKRLMSQCFDEINSALPECDRTLPSA